MPRYRSLRFLIPSIALLALEGCPYYSDCGSIALPHTAFALTPLNTPYDDWNACDPNGRFQSDRLQAILFSSNRATKGGAFDLTPMEFALYGNDSSFKVEGGPATLLDSLVALANTAQDEIGPSFWFPRDSSDDSVSEAPQALVFARGDSSDHDIHALVWTGSEDESSQMWNFTHWTYGKGREPLDDIRLPAPLNSASDEAYATWSPKVGRILFHSNRSGTYRIWEAIVPGGSTNPFRWLRHASDSGVQVRMVAELASNGQERCPYLLGNRLYFVSDRVGGQGGFDIYTSDWNGTTWSTPRNMGPKINSTSDEYRPFAMLGSMPSDPSALIFSSNRPGGKGGYDLYMVGL